MDQIRQFASRVEYIHDYDDKRYDNHALSYGFERISFVAKMPMYKQASIADRILCTLELRSMS